MITTGRPLQALGLLGVVVTLWLAVRVPEMGAQFAATMARMQPADPPAMAAQAMRVPVVMPLVLPLLHPSLPRLRRLGPPAPAAGGPHLPSNPGFDLATRAYASFAAGNRRTASGLFAAALQAAPDAEQAPQWAAERQRLNRRWSGDAYVLFRDAEPGGAVATPVLGGGQMGGSVGWAVDALARRPLALIGRVYAALDDRGLVDGSTAQAAVGVRWQALPGVSVAAERLIAIGSATSGDWNLRVAAGGDRRVGPAAIDGHA